MKESIMDYDGHPWACGCGERYSAERYAWGCKKCRAYLTPEDFDAREVVDLREEVEA